MQLPIRHSKSALLASMLLFASTAFAQSYPDKAIKLVVPFVPGGATDLVARAVGKEMSKTLGQPIIIENRPGNAGAVGADFTAKSAPDGYTMCLCTVGSLVTAPILNPTVTYKPLRDLMPVSMVNRVELGLFARSDLPASNLKDLVAAAKAAPGKFSYATTGITGPNYLAFQVFLQRAGIDMLHVPYKGDGQSVVALAGGEIDLFVGGLQSALPLMQAGRVKPIVLTGMERSRMAPDVPTANESGFPGYEHSVWAGIVVAAKTDPSIVKKLQGAVALAVQQPAVREIFDANGLVGVGSSPDEFREVIENNTIKYAEVIKRLNIKLN
jgi:tripartite-type tricarboxylate transporter receptor subunit TctC